MGDGTVIKGTSATHYYKFPGKFRITCTLYNIDGSPVENSLYTDVIVKEVIPTELSFVDPANWKQNIAACKNNFLGSMQVTLSNNISSEPAVSAIRRWEEGKNENSYFDINKDFYYHLEKYYTFLERRIIHKIDSNYLQSMLQPTEEYIPEYLPLYGKYVDEGGEMKLKVYAVADKTNDYLISTVNPLYNYFNDSNTSDRETIDYIHKVRSINDIPADASLIGKVALIDIWYKNDNLSKNDLIFEFKKETLKFFAEPLSSEPYLNIPPLGLSVNTVMPSTEDNIITAFTSNGLYSVKDINDDNNVKIDTHLIYNLYLNYKVEAYYSNFILNDNPYDEDITYSLLKHQIADYPLTSISVSYSTGCNVIPSILKDYYKVYDLTPTKLEGFKLFDINNNLLYTSNRITALENIVLPSEKRINQDTQKILDTYMQHPMYDEATNLKTFLLNIFGNNDMLSYITSKGVNLLDDTVNYKTCYLDKFLSILEMLNENSKVYDINSFDKINDLKEMVRIMTMNYSQLFGNILKNEYDIRITHSTTGTNVGDILHHDDIILCDIDEKTGNSKNVVAIRRNGKVYPIIAQSPYIIIKDDFTLKTRLINFVGIKAPIIDDLSDQTPEWKAKYGWSKLYGYSLDDYEESWGWSLNLPEDLTYKTNKSLFIDTYYTLYLFNPLISSRRMYNFVSESTIPRDKNNNQISVEDWNKDYGFTYDCLMKILTSSLMLRDSN